MVGLAADPEKRRGRRGREGRSGRELELARTKEAGKEIETHRRRGEHCRWHSNSGRGREE